MTNQHKNNFNIDETIWAGWEVFKKEWKNLLWAVVAYIAAVIPLNIIDFIWNMRLYNTETYLPEGATEEVTRQIWAAGASETILYFIFAALMFVWSIIVGFNILKASFKIYDGKKFEFAEMFAIPKDSVNFYHLLRYVGSIIVTVVIVLGPAVLLGLVGLLVYVTGGYEAIMASTGLIALVVAAIIGAFVAIMYLAIRFGFAVYLVIDKNTSVVEAFSTSSKMTDGVKWKLIGLGLVQVLLVIGIIIAGLICLIVGVIPAYFIAIAWMVFSDIFIMRKLYEANK